jgi:hypothetical protein
MPMSQSKNAKRFLWGKKYVRDFYDDSGSVETRVKNAPAPFPNAFCD